MNNQGNQGGNQAGNQGGNQAQGNPPAANTTTTTTVVTQDVETIKALPYNGSEEKYHECSLKVKALAKKKDFWETLINDTKNTFMRKSNQANDVKAEKAYDNAWYFL